MILFESLQSTSEPDLKRKKVRRGSFKLFLSTFCSLLALGSQNTFAQSNTESTSADTTQTTTTQTETPKKDHSSGGLFIEPILLGASENFSMKTAQLPLVTSNTSGTTEGYGLGLRLGIHASEVIFLGVDGRYDKEQMKDSFYQTADADVYNFGPTIGLQMPYFGLRLMGTYVMAGEFNPAPGTNGLDLNFKDPRGWRLGAGIHAGPVSINLEYQDLTYGTTVIESLGSFAANSSVNMQTETTGYILSLSFPVEL
jgi:hypothetical protein